MEREQLIERIKQDTTVYVAAAVCGIVLPRPGAKCRVPWREDRTPSASVFPDGRSIFDFGQNESKDGLGLIMELRGVSFPVAVNMAAEALGAPVPFEDQMGTGRSWVKLDNLGRWPGQVEEVEPVAPIRASGGGIANFKSISVEAVNEMLVSCCRALAENEVWQEHVAEWRGFSVSFVRALAVEGKLGAARNEEGDLCVVLPCVKTEAGLWARAQIRRVGPRQEGCEWFWPAKSDHKPGPWVAAEGLAGGLVIVAEGWGDAAAARLLAGEPEARIVATLGTGARKLEGVSAGAVWVLRQNEEGDANERWARSLRALFPTVSVKSIKPPAGVKDWNDVLKRHGQELGEKLLEDARSVRDDEVIEGMTPEMAGRKSPFFNDTLAAEMLAEVTEGGLKHDAVSGWHELHEDGHWEQVPPKRALWWAGRMAAQAKIEAEEVKKKIMRGGDKKGKGIDAAENMLRFAHLAGCARGQKAALELALAREDMTASFEPWKLNKWLLPTKSGMLDLRRDARSLWRAFRPADHVTWRAGVEFDEMASCPRWMAFVASICDGDKEMEGFLQRWAGYMLTGDVSEQVVLFLFGMGSNGKSTFLGVLQAVLGDFARVVPLSMVTLDRMGNAAPDVEMVRLKGARLAVPPELEKGARLAEANVKTLSGGDRLRGRGHYKESEEFAPSHKLAFYSNSKPGIKGGDEGIWRRLNLVHLRRAFKGAEKIKGLDAVLREELSGILNWMIAGCWEWQRVGLRPPQSVLDEVEEYRETSDALGTFLDETLEHVPVHCITLGEIRKRLKEWANSEGESWLAGLSTRKLRKEMEERGWEVKVDRKNSPFVLGCWKDENDSQQGWEDGE